MVKLKTCLEDDHMITLFENQNLRRNPPEVQVASGQKPSAKIIYIVLQTSV